MDELKKIIEALNATGFAGGEISLTKPDGSPDLDAIRKVLEGDEYKDFRSKNPEAVKDLAKTNTLTRLGFGLELANTLNKIAFATGQQREARNMDTSPPSMPSMRRNAAVDGAISMAMSQGSRGMSPQEYNAALGEIQSGAAGAQSAIINTTTGGATQNNLQALAISQMGQRRNLSAQDAQVRTSRQQQSLSAARFQQQRDQARMRAQQFLFANRDLPMANYRRQYRDRLMQAGITNGFRGGDAFVENMANARAIFGPTIPGVVRRGDNRYGGTGTELDSVFDNDAQFLETGGNIMDDPESFMQQRYWNVFEEQDQNGSSVFDYLQPLDY